MDGWLWSDIKPDGARDWQKESNHWFRKYLASRKRCKNLLAQQRALRVELMTVYKTNPPQFRDNAPESF